MAVQVYLLAIISGQQNTSPSDLANAARCWSSCIPPGDQMAVGNYLLAQLLS
jgi:hypothetical protein